MHAENYLRIYLLKEEKTSGPELDKFHQEPKCLF